MKQNNQIKSEQGELRRTRGLTKIMRMEGIGLKKNNKFVRSRGMVAKITDKGG